jgi:hypothetical protein
MTRDERNAIDAVPAQAGISVFQQPANSLFCNVISHQFTRQRFIFNDTIL